MAPSPAPQNPLPKPPRHDFLDAVPHVGALDFSSPAGSEIFLGFDWDVPDQILALETWQTADLELAALTGVEDWPIKQLS
jgi:hypothetical protein